MLRMGFVDAVESDPRADAAAAAGGACSPRPSPAPIRRIAQKHLRSPVEVTIQSKTSTATNIRQRYWLVSGMHKLDALTRILETETFDGMLVFTRTKQATVELAEKLEARGFSAAPLNGDIPQAAARAHGRAAEGRRHRHRRRHRRGGARPGRRAHRPRGELRRAVRRANPTCIAIGRTGRAGRKGEAILFIAPRERKLLRAIERATRQRIEPMNLPTVDAVNASRIAKFKVRISETVAKGRAAEFRRC